MESPLNPGQQNAVLMLIAQSSNGVSVDEIAAVIHPAPDMRQLRRWLESLVDEEQILPLKTGREKRYVAVNPAALLASLRDSVAGVPPPAATPASAADPRGLRSSGLQEAGAAAAPASVSFDELFAAVALNVISLHLRRPAVLAIVQNVALKNIASPDDRRVFIAYAIKQLDELTMDAAKGYGLLPEQYVAWREVCPAAD